MIERVRRLAYRLGATFWFVPSAIVAGATALAFLAIEADARYVAADALQAWPRLFGAGASASRSLLTATAGSMITVAGTVFSITLVALSLASSQYSSRVLRNFMRDRTNQSVLGVFLGIFAYCLVVLRSIYGNGDDAFVPSVAVLLGLLLGFGGIGVLVFFIHHIAQSIQASHILEAVRSETFAAIDRLFPHKADPAVDGTGQVAPECEWHEARQAHANGYLQFVDYAALSELARAHGVVLKVHPRVGAYVLEGDRLLSSAPKPPEGLGAEAAACWTLGPQRTLEQDVGFGIRQLVDVALKALSPGVNDTTTAIMCIDTLTAILARLAPRDLRFEGCHVDGATCIHACHPSFEGLLAEAFDQIRLSAGDNPAVLDRLLWSLQALESRTDVPDRQRALHAAAATLLAHSVRVVRDPREAERIGRGIRRFLEGGGGGDGGSPIP